MNEVTVTSQTLLRLAGDGAVGEVHLSADEWRVIARVNSARSVAEIAASLNADLAPVVALARQLLNVGLLAVADDSASAAPAFVGASFFESIEKELTLVMGPIGPILIEEQVTSIGETRGRFPREKLAELVEAVGVQITDERNRVDFLRIMLTQLHKSSK
jgi:hypothetical protein